MQKVLQNPPAEPLRFCRILVEARLGPFGSPGTSFEDWSCDPAGLVQVSKQPKRPKVLLRESAKGVFGPLE